MYCLEMFSMFIREYKTKNKKTDKIYKTHKLVESIRTEKGPRQRIVMGLGTLTLPKKQWKKLAAVIETKLTGQTLMPINSVEIERIADQAIENNKLNNTIAMNENTRALNQQLLKVDINSLSTMNSKSLGPEIVANNAWEKLDIDQMLTECKFDQRQKALAKSVIIGRLINPGSDIETFRWFQKRSSLNEFLNVDLSIIGKDSFYKIADDLLDNKNKLEKLLQEKEAKLYGRTKDSIFLYDLTNTYLEGSALNNKLATFGKCKSKRYDCRIITLAIVVDSLGFPILSQIYAGNQSEPKTLKDVLKRIQRDLYNQQETITKPTLIMDRGIATSSNIDFIKDNGYEYVVIDRKNLIQDYEEEFKNAKDEFEIIQSKKRSAYGDFNNVYVKKVDYTKELSRVLCLSEGKEKKEIAIDSKKENNFLEDVNKLKKSISKGSVKKSDVIYKRLGKLKERHSRVSKNYILDTINNKDSKITDILVRKKTVNNSENEKPYGCYVIETTHTKLKATEIWNLYMTLTTVENSFRALKSELGLRPIYHQTEERTKGHLFISVLAYHLLNTIEVDLSKHNDNRQWKTILSDLSTHQRNTVVLNTEEGETYHVRLSGTPESSHKDVYRKLFAEDPLKKVNRLAKTVCSD